MRPDPVPIRMTLENEPPVMRTDMPVRMVAPVVPEEMPVAGEDMLMAVVAAVISEAEGNAVGACGRIGKPDQGGGCEGESKGPESHDNLRGLKVRVGRKRTVGKLNRG